MNNYSIWDWLILLLLTIPIILGVILGLRSRFNRNTSDHLAGFGGWLFLLAFGQTIAPLKALVGAVRSFNFLPKLSEISGEASLIYAETICKLLIGVFSVFVATVMYKRSHRFPTFFTLEWVISFVFVTLEPVFVGLWFDLPIRMVYTPETMGSITGLIGSSLWVWYVWRSRRVKNTFIR